MIAPVTDWKLSRNSVPIAQIKNFLRGIDQTKIVQKALDGSIYIQTIGDGNKYADIEILVQSDDRLLVNAAEADGALVSVVYKDKRYLGYIEAAVAWSFMLYHGNWYTGTMRLLIQEEIAL